MLRIPRNQPRLINLFDHFRTFPYSSDHVEILPIIAMDVHG